MAIQNEIYATSGYTVVYDLVRKVPDSVRDEVRSQFGGCRLALLWLHSFEESFFKPEEMEVPGKETGFTVAGAGFVDALCCLVLKKKASRLLNRLRANSAILDISTMKVGVSGNMYSITTETISINHCHWLGACPCDPGIRLGDPETPPNKPLEPPPPDVPPGTPEELPQETPVEVPSEEPIEIPPAQPPEF